MERSCLEMRWRGEEVDAIIPNVKLELYFVVEKF